MPFKAKVNSGKPTHERGSVTFYDGSDFKLKRLSSR